MLSNECWLVGWHDHCTEPKFCDCLCHVTLDELDGL